MAIIDARGFFKRMQRFRRFIRSPVADEIIGDMAKMSVDMIYKRVKAGYGVSDDTDDTPVRIRLARLSKSYKFARKIMEGTKGNFTGFKAAKISQKTGKKLKSRGIVLIELNPPMKFGKFFKAGKSNLTMTGQMLDSMTYKKKRRGFQIYIPGTTRTDGLYNDQVAKWVSEQGRPFLALDYKEQLQLQKFLARSVRDKLRKLRSKV